MTIPSTLTQLLVTLVLIVPGFVYQNVRIRVAGRTPADTELASRILRAIVASTVFALLYLLILGPEIIDTAQASRHTLDHPRRLALLGFCAAFAIPALSATVIHVRWSTALFKHPIQTMRDEGWSRYDPRPTAWDVAFQDASVGFVRVRMRDGTWFAGYYGPNSYASSYPDPPNLFVEASFDIDDRGVIENQIVNTKGAVIDCTDAVLVELLAPLDEADEAQSQSGGEDDD
jgi:hypothetical protein